MIEGGVPFNRAHDGLHLFEYNGLDQRFNQVFNNAMINHTTMVIKIAVESYNGFANLKQLVDVGGGLGVTLKIITSAYPSIKGINFDLPHVIQDAPSYPRKQFLLQLYFQFDFYSFKKIQYYSSSSIIF